MGISQGAQSASVEVSKKLMLKYEYIADPLNAMCVDLHCLFSDGRPQQSTVAQAERRTSYLTTRLADWHVKGDCCK